MDPSFVDVEAIKNKYPRLAPYNFVVIDSRGKPSEHGGQLEFYHPEESKSPRPGYPTIEVFNPELQGEDLSRAVFGDMLHYLPDVDAKFGLLRSKFRTTLTPEQLAVDQRVYEQDRKNRGEDRPFDDWFERSRLDAYLRGYLAPDQNDEWRKSGVYTPEQVQLLDAMRAYLMDQK